eukprot:SAG31_NODE_2602_length_5401_cov_26.913052_4_plen_36_part_00
MKDVHGIDFHDGDVHRSVRLNQCNSLAIEQIASQQ